MIGLFRKIGYRVFQFSFYYGSRLLPWRVPVQYRGPGTLAKLPDILALRKLGNVMVVTDRQLMSLGLPNRALRLLEDANIKYTLFDEVEPNPSTDTVEALRKSYADHACQGFVAFGGGSVMDAAKAAGARIARPKRTLEQMGGFLKVLKRIPPIIAIPTTAGTGSETTIAAVVTDYTTHRKFALSDLSLIPHVAILDPELTIGLPPAITAATGMDALTHAVESYLCLFVSKKCRKFSEDAVRIIFGSIEKATADGSDLHAREQMLAAAFLGGSAFTRAGLNYIHPIAHTLSGLYKEAHGRANAVVMPHVLRYYGAPVHQKLAKLALCAGLPVAGMSDAEAANAFIEAISRLNRVLLIPDGFDYIRDADIPQICDWALAEANPFYPVPILYGKEEIAEIVSLIRKPTREANI